MTIIVENIKTKQKYVCIGTGLGMYQSKKPHWFLGDIAANTENGIAKSICVCDKLGRIIWFPTEIIKIVSVNGRNPSELL